MAIRWITDLWRTRYYIHEAPWSSMSIQCSAINDSFKWFCGPTSTTSTTSTTDKISLGLVWIRSEIQNVTIWNLCIVVQIVATRVFEKYLNLVCIQRKIRFVTVWILGVTFLILQFCPRYSERSDSMHPGQGAPRWMTLAFLVRSSWIVILSGAAEYFPFSRGCGQNGSLIGYIPSLDNCPSSNVTPFESWRYGSLAWVTVLWSGGDGCFLNGSLKRFVVNRRHIQCNLLHLN